MMHEAGHIFRITDFIAYNKKCKENALCFIPAWEVEQGSGEIPD